MKIVRCTNKLVKAFGLKRVELPHNADIDALLGEWYANVLRIGRRNWLLCTHSDTLYSFLVPNARKQEMSQFDRLFTQHLTQNLLSEGMKEDSVSVIIGDGAISIGATQSRSVLGSMNDLASMSRFYLEEYEDMAEFDPVYVNKRINRVPMSAIGYRYSLDALRARLEHLEI